MWYIAHSPEGVAMGGANRPAVDEENSEGGDGRMYG